MNTISENFGQLFVVKIRDEVLDYLSWACPIPHDGEPLSEKFALQSTVAQAVLHVCWGLCSALDHNTVTLAYRSRMGQASDLTNTGELWGFFCAEWVFRFSKGKFYNVIEKRVDDASLTSSQDSSVNESVPETGPAPVSDIEPPQYTGYTLDADSDAGMEAVPPLVGTLFTRKLDLEVEFGRLLVQRVHDPAMSECDTWFAPDARGPKVDRLNDNRDQAHEIFPNIVDMTLYILLQAVGNGDIGLIWRPWDEDKDCPVGDPVELTHNKDLAGLYLRKWRREYSTFPWHDDFAEEEAS